MLGTEPATVGRGLGNDLVVDDERVSRRHIQVRAQGGGVMVEDLGSRNGTRIGGVRLMGSRVVPVGERITIGRTSLLVGPAAVVVAPPRAIPAPCRRARALMERDLDDELEVEAQAFLHGHVAGCPDCGRRHDLAVTWRGKVDEALIEAPPAGLADRVTRALRDAPGP